MRKFTYRAGTETRALLGINNRVEKIEGYFITAHGKSGEFFVPKEPEKYYYEDEERAKINKVLRIIRKIEKEDRVKEKHRIFNDKSVLNRARYNISNPITHARKRHNI